MEKLNLKAGDLFCTENVKVINRMINKWQNITSADGKSKYAHSGIITDSDGTIFEAVGTNNINNLYSRYKGKEIVIARYESISDDQWKELLTYFIKKYNGHKYPFHRIFFHLVPMVAKYCYLNKKNLVCSELVAELLHQAYLRFGKNENGYCWPRHKYSRGTTPDMLSDEWHRWKKFKIIFEGIL